MIGHGVISFVVDFNKSRCLEPYEDEDKQYSHDSSNEIENREGLGSFGYFEIGAENDLAVHQFIGHTHRRGDREVRWLLPDVTHHGLVHATQGRQHRPQHRKTHLRDFQQTHQKDQHRAPLQQLQVQLHAHTVTTEVMLMRFEWIPISTSRRSIHNRATSTLRPRLLYKAGVYASYIVLCVCIMHRTV